MPAEDGLQKGSLSILSYTHTSRNVSKAIPYIKRSFFMYGYLDILPLLQFAGECWWPIPGPSPRHIPGTVPVFTSLGANLRLELLR